MSQQFKNKIDKLEEKYRVIADNLLDAIWVVDLKTLKFDYITPSIEKIRGLYCSCDIWVCASLVEGCALVPAEAMACRCALVATNIGGIRDYVIDGETALLSTPGNSQMMAQNIISLIENKNKLKRISEAGYNMIRKFTWERAVDILEKELLEGIDTGL